MKSQKMASPFETGKLLAPLRRDTPTKKLSKSKEAKESPAVSGKAFSMKKGEQR
jgi:hypothetical protein